MSETPPTPIAKPVQPGERVDFVDILRGFAILGIFVINIIGFASQPEGLQFLGDPIDRFFRLFSEFFFRAKFYTLFSFLFGWGMAVILRRAEARGVAFARLYRRRLLILLAMGILHGTLLWAGDILTIYALFGFLLLWFRKRSDKTILITSFGLLLFAIFLTLPWGIVQNFRDWYEGVTAVFRPGTLGEGLYATGTYAEITRLRTQIFISATSWFIFYFGNVFAMFLWGLYVGRRRFFENISQYSRQVWQLFGVSLFVAVLANGLFIAISRWSGNNGWPAWIPNNYHSFVRIGARSIGAPAMMLVYVTGVILLLRRQRWRQQLAPLANVGRLALSNYIFQSIIGGFIFYNYGLGLYGEIGPSFSLLLVVLIYLWQIRLSAWWLERYQFGPLEWVWRSLMYGRRQPMRRGITYADLPAYSGRDFLPRSRMARLLTAVWSLLLVWTLVLAVRVAQIGQPDDNLLSAIAGGGASATPTPRPTAVSQPTPEPTPIATPVVQPVSANPGPLVASGDLRALADAFDPAQAMTHIENLVKYDGRLAGSPGGYAAADYIADQFARYGLQPAGEDGTFFQSFPVQPLQLTQTPQLVVETGDGRPIAQFQANEDFSLIAFGFVGDGEAEGGVVWANNCEHADFDAVAVVGQIVLCRQAGSVLQAGRNAVEHGAAGLLLLSPADGSPEDFAFPYNRSWLAEGLTIPAFRVNTAVAAALVQDSGKTAADLTIHFTPFHLNTRVRMSADLVGEPACAVQPCTGRNVLGVLPGQNPEYASEVVILGGHYDHMGHSPDGVVWWGANDNASGIAALLEIARVWHEEGFVPQRTVLFAAWDGEELGLLGSSHYAEFPQYPLDKTVGAIQLDMVGAGEETLYIDGSGGLETELAAIASSYSITNTLSTLGRSDHTPFLQAGVPSNLLIWFGGGDGVPSYHRPIDTPAVIEPEKLAGAGRVAGAMALTLAEVEPQIEQMLAVRAVAIENNDEAPFLETAVSERQSLESTWFADVQTLSPLTVTLTAGHVQLLADGAVADVNLALVFPAEDGNNRASTLSFAARFLPGVSGWQWAGANLTRTADGRFTAAIAADAGLDAAEVAQIAARTYTAVAQKLGRPDGGGAIRLYPDTDALRGDTAVTLPPGTSQTVSPGQVNLLYSPQITASETLTRSLVQLALANAGVMEANAPWLWQGLPLAMAAENNVAAAHFRYLPDLREALAAEELPLNEATAYAAMDYLQRRIGWQGIGALVTAVGRSGWDTALRTVVNLDGAGFAQAWQEDWQTRLAAADAGVTAVLDARAEAIQNRNQSAFLNTVDGRMPALAAEQRHWFTALDEADGPVAWAGRPVVLYPDGRLLADTTLTGLAAGPQGARVLFTPEGNGWRWAGALFAELSDEQVTVFYPAGQQALARQIQAEARLQAPQIAADLGVTTTWPVSIKLYASEGMFQTAVSPALARGSWVTSWAGADESVRMRVWPEMEPADWQPSLLAALARQELEQQGVTSQWLLQGVSLWQVERMLGRLPAGMAEGNLTKLLRAVNGEDWPSLADMPSEAALDAENGRVLNAGAVDAVRTVTYRYGREGLAALIQAQAAGNDLETAVFQALGLSLAEFEANWADSLAVAHISSDWLDIANQFNVDRVMVDIDFITQPDFDGRQAGSPGAAAVAAYIAEQFDAVGLRPLGDDIASSDAMSAFGQTFPVRYVTVPAAPRLDVVDADGHLVESFVYREDFVTALDQVVSSGEAAGELVLVTDGNYTGMDLTGKIVLRQPTEPWAEEAARAAEHGAAGLILVGSQERLKDYLAKPALPITFTQTLSMPILMLTQPGYRHFLEVVGQTLASVTSAPASLPLGVRAEIGVWISEPVTVQSANVLGLWPGADPGLRDEVIILGAHYDFVGDDPELLLCDGRAVGQIDPAEAANCERIPGLDYSGANDDASGLAVMLETVRLWQETGYQPQRSILFAAWGAQEAGEVGSNFYVANPAVPLTQTVGILQLDAVGGGGGYYLSAQGFWETEGMFLYGMKAAEDLVDGRLKTTTSTGISDQLPFRTAGAPGMLATWTDANETNWPDSIADEVEPNRLGVTGRMVVLTMMSVAR